MKLGTEKFYALIIIFANFFLTINNFKFTGNDDLIIKFNVENTKFKNPEYVYQVKKKLKKEMSLLKRKLMNSRKIPDDIDLEGNVKIYEEQKNMGNKGNQNDNIDEDDSYISDFEEKDLIKSNKFLLKSFLMLRTTKFQI